MSILSKKHVPSKAFTLWFILFLLHPLTNLALANQAADEISKQSSKVQWRKLNQNMLQAFESGDNVKAVEWAKISLKFSRNEFGDKHPDTLTAMNSLALLYVSMRLYEEAEPLYLKELSLSKEVLGKKHPDTLTVMNDLVRLYKYQGRYKKAEPLCSETLARRIEVLGERHSDTLATMNHLAVIYKNQGLYKKAETLYIRTLTLKKEVLGDTHPSTLLSVNNLAALYNTQGYYEKAEPLYVETIALSKKLMGENHPDTLISITNLAGLYFSMGRYEKAEPLYVETLALKKEIRGKEHPSTLTSMNNLALLYKYQGRYEKAEKLYIETLALRKKVLGEKHPDTLNSMNSLATVYTYLNRYDVAERLYLKALTVSEETLGKRHPNTLASMSDIAILYNTQGRYDEAEPLYIKTLSLRKEVLGKKHPHTLSSMNNLAVFYKYQGEYEKAEKLFIEKLSLSKEILGENHPSTLISLSNLVATFSAREKYSETERLLDEMWTAYDAFLQQILWGAGEITRIGYIHQQDSEKDFAFSFYAEHNKPENAKRALKLSLARKGLLLQLATQIKAVSRSTRNPKLKALSDALIIKRKQLSTLVLSGKSNTTQASVLEEQVNRQQAELGRHVQQLKRGHTNVSPEQVITALSENTAFVDFHIYRQTDLKTINKASTQLLALVVNPANNPVVQLIPLGEMSSIAADIKLYQDGIRIKSGQLPPYNRKLAQRLYHRIWSPLHAQLSGISEVFVAPDGTLNLLPFSGLIDDSGEYLIKRVNITMLSSGRDLVIPSLEGEVSEPIIVSAPLYDSQQIAAYDTDNRNIKGATTGRAIKSLYFSPLPGTLIEGEAVYKILKKQDTGTKHFKLDAATEQAVAAVKSPRILHLATHGFFLEDLPVANYSGTTQPTPLHTDTHRAPLKNQGNPLLRSGLALAGANLSLQPGNSGRPGILMAEEVLDLKLAGTDLVVLSACDTGIGEIRAGEGVYGLRRAFQEAGAKAVLSTLWSISDTGTQHFMERFYQRFLSGVDAQQALRDTQLEFINSKKWNHPFFWAPFVMVGKL